MMRTDNPRHDSARWVGGHRDSREFLRTGIDIRSAAVSTPLASGAANSQTTLVFRLRPYDKRDFDRLWKIDQLCFEPEIAFSRPELSSYVARRRSFTIVAELALAPGARSSERPPIAGFITTEMTRDGLGHIITIDVLPEHRRTGLGTQLLLAAEEQVRKLAGFMMVLEVAVNNAAARAFYERHGYKVVKTLPLYYNHKIDGLFLTKRL